MNDQGPGILNAVEQVRDFFAEIARMYGALDPIMREAGWVPIGGTTATYQTSTSLTQPRRWIPRYVFRFYSCSARKELFGSVTALLSREYQSADGKALVEPLLSGVILDYGPGNDVGQNYNWDVGTWHPRMEGRSDDGRVLTVVRSPDDISPAVRVATWAVPLIKIGDSTSLKTHTADVFSQWVQNHWQS